VTKEKVAANKYELSGVDEREGDGMAGIPARYEIVYTPDGLELTAHAGGGSHAIGIETYKPSELRSVAVVDLGTCVSFTRGLHHDGTASETGTLLIPRVLLTADTESAAVDTLFVLTSHGGRGDGSVEPQQEQYEVIKLTGTATRNRDTR